MRHEEVKLEAAGRALDRSYFRFKGGETIACEEWLIASNKFQYQINTENSLLSCPESFHFRSIQAGNNF